MARGSRLVMEGALFLFLTSACVSIAVNSLALGVMAAGWVALMASTRRLEVSTTPLDLFVAGYLGAQLLATVFSVNPAQSLEFSKRLLLIGIVYFFVTHCSGNSSLRRSAAVLLGAGTLVAILGVGKLVFGSAEDRIRLGVFQFYMTTSGQMMVIGLLLVPFAVHRSTPSRVRWATIAALVPVTVVLYATVTRGAYLAFMAGVVVIALVRDRRLLIPLLALLLVVLLAAPPYVAGRLTNLVDLNHPENVTRVMMWRSGLRIFAEHPFVGVGDIDLGDLMRQHADPGYPGEWGHMHNTPLQILVTLGVVGFVAVAALFVAIAAAEWRVYRRVRDDWFLGSVTLGALAVFAGLQVNGLTEWSFGDQEIAVLFWITVGMALAAGRVVPAVEE
jgi:O-antigen ligase